jgi:hypothetical protein
MEERLYAAMRRAARLRGIKPLLVVTSELVPSQLSCLFVSFVETHPLAMSRCLELISGKKQDLGFVLTMIH